MTEPKTRKTPTKATPKSSTTKSSTTKKTRTTDQYVEEILKAQKKLAGQGLTSSTLQANDLQNVFNQYSTNDHNHATITTTAGGSPYTITGMAPPTAGGYATSGYSTTTTAFPSAQWTTAPITSTGTTIQWTDGQGMYSSTPLGLSREEVLSLMKDEIKKELEAGLSFELEKCNECAALLPTKDLRAKADHRLYHAEVEEQLHQLRSTIRKMEKTNGNQEVH